MLGRTIRSLLEVRQEAKHPLLVGTVILVFLSFSWRVRHRQLLKQWTQRISWSFKRMWGPLSRRLGGLWLSLDSPQGIRSSLHLVRWNMSLHLSHCRETRPSFESGHLGVHSSWVRKHRVPLIYLFLREGSFEVLVDIWLTSSLEDRESFSSRDDMGCTERSSSCSTEIDDPLYLRRLSQGVSRGS